MTKKDVLVWIIYSVNLVIATSWTISAFQKMPDQSVGILIGFVCLYALTVVGPAVRAIRKRDYWPLGLGIASLLIVTRLMERQ